MRVSPLSSGCSRRRSCWAPHRARSGTALRLDAQQYLFSGDIADGYTPHLGTRPLRSPGTRARSDFVLLAGISWRAK